MPIQKRTLTVNFQRSITAGVPNTMEVAVTPLSEPRAPEQDLSLVGGTQNRVVVLANETTPVSFELVPTDSPELDQRVIYRIAWRERFLGRQYTHDFVMPNANVNFADLSDLGSILGGETYLQWDDRGVPGGVAALNSLGQVIDAAGNPVISSDDAASALAIVASGGIEKITSTNTSGDTIYTFRLDPDEAVRKWSGLVVPTTGNLGTVTHNLGTIHVLAVVRETATRIPVPGAVIRPNADGNGLLIEFASPPLSGQYTAVVLG
jgi:hypothetical protein